MTPAEHERLVASAITVTRAEVITTYPAAARLLCPPLTTDEAVRATRARLRRRETKAQHNHSAPAQSPPQPPQQQHAEINEQNSTGVDFSNVQQSPPVPRQQRGKQLVTRQRAAIEKQKSTGVDLSGVSRDDLIAAHPIVEFLHSRGHELKQRGENFETNACPAGAHTKRGHTPVTIYPATQSWFCHDHDEGGSVIDWLKIEKQISPIDAMRELAGGGNDSEPRAPLAVRHAKSLAAKAKPQLFNWQSCVDAVTDKHLEHLAEWRGYSREFCAWLKESRLVGIVDGCIAFPVHYDGEIVGAHVRLQNGNWYYEPQGIKAAPLIVGELVAGEPVHLFESTWDALAFMDKTGERSGIVCTRGAANGKFAAVIPERCTVYAWKQNDELKNGRRAGDDWLKTSCEHAEKSCTIKLPPVTVHDLNDWTRDGATSDDLFKAMLNAATVREAEISWLDALQKSILTPSALRQLKLAPREKILGDWLCEGDCGFVYAPRGVGKTWFGVALARTIANGNGKLGEWTAHKAIPVLYLDSEMPPDLMNARIQGLEASDNLTILNHDVLFQLTNKVMNIANAEFQKALTDFCITSGKKLLVIDNLSTAATGVKENEADDWEKISSWLLDLRRRRIAVIIIHHAGRSGHMRGTTKREDAVFWIIALDDMKNESSDKRGACFITRFDKPSRNTQEAILPYEWHFITEPDGLVTIGCKITQSLEVFRSVIESGVTRTSEIAEAMKLAGYEVSRMAKQAIGQGWLKKLKRGEYELTQQTEKEEAK